jgi:hypothetical protein
MSNSADQIVSIILSVRGNKLLREIAPLSARLLDCQLNCSVEIVVISPSLRSG